jgi:cob(I)alamin adenosyltransferase
VDPELKRNRRGIVLVFTGNGKGKTTAAMGLALRAAGNRLPVRVIQFIKGSWKTGERTAFREWVPGVEIAAEGRGFTIEGLRDPQVSDTEHLEAGRNAWAIADEAVRGGAYRLVVLDEILGSITAGLVPLDEVLRLMREKPRDVHLVLTGRNAPPEVVAAADCVTEMREVKHHYRGAGIPAQRGIEF